MPATSRDRIRAADEAGRGPHLVWDTRANTVTVLVYADVPGFPAPPTVLEDLGPVRPIEGGYGPWDPGYWSAPLDLAAAAGWKPAAVNNVDGIPNGRGWTRQIDGYTYVAVLDRTASADAMARHGDTLAQIGVAVDVPGAAADLVRRMRAHRDAAVEQDSLIDEGIAAQMGDREIARELGVSHTTVWRRRGGYFEAKARAAFEKAGGDPDRAGDLAAWARAAHPEGDTRRGVLVAESGALVAETLRCAAGPGASSAAYVVGSPHAEVIGREVGLAASALQRVVGRVIHVTYSAVCTGSGRYV